MAKIHYHMRMLRNEDRMNRFFRVREKTGTKMPTIKSFDVVGKYRRIRELAIFEFGYVWKMLRSWEAEDREMERFLTHKKENNISKLTSDDH